MLFMVHPEYRPKRPTSQFVARLYGFKIHPMAYQLQQEPGNKFKPKFLTPTLKQRAIFCTQFLKVMFVSVLFISGFTNKSEAVSVK